METLIPVAIILALTGGLFWGLFRLLVPKAGPAMVCTQCGHHGPAKRHTRGSLGIEVLAWLLFIIPGLFYSLWRLATRADVCASCGAGALVAPGSPVGRRMIMEAAEPEAQYSRP